MGTSILICLCVLLALSTGAPTENEPTTNAASAQKCSPGTSKFDGCNTCVCLKDGSGYSCTKKICEPRATAITKEDLCNPGEYIGMEGCIPCVCVKDGSEEVCTKKKCDDTSTTSKGKTCEPGHSEHDGCNTCVCNSESTSKECTKQICN